MEARNLDATQVDHLGDLRRDAREVVVGELEICEWTVDIRLQEKGNSKLPWRKAGPPNRLVDVVGSDQ